MRLKNKRALITGASSGLGRAMAIRFAREGAKVAFTGRREDRLREVQAEIASLEASGFAIVADHARPSDNQRTIERALVELGGLDILVNNAGAIDYDGLLEPKPEVFRRLIDLNLSAVYDLTHRATPHLVASRGNVVNVSSVAGLRPYPGLLGYCVSKAGVDMLTQASAIELAPHGVRVNAINPGVVVTELHRASGMSQESYDRFLERCKSTHPLGRPGTAEEVASLVVFLASDEAGWITGELCSIDGGRALTSLR